MTPYPKRVVVAMSGGVDSSVAAALLVEQGYEVIGVMMRLWAEEPSLGSGDGENRCCAPEAVEDARRVAAHLGIPFYLVNYEAEFKACVVDYFVAEYSRGRTPNPCLACNRHIRFGRLLRHAQALEAELPGHRALCPRGRGQRSPPAAHGRRPAEGSILRALHAGPGGAATGSIPRGRLHQDPGPGDGPPAGPASGREG